MNTKLLTALLAGSLLLLASCTDSDTQTPSTWNNDTAQTVESNTEVPQVQEPSEETWVELGGAVMLPSQDVVDNIAMSLEHTTLVTALQSANLIESLKEIGPFTVFAPSDNAFWALPDGTVETLLQPENNSELANILAYHVVPGNYTTDKLIDGLELETLQGQSIVIEDENGKWTANGASISVANAESINGTIHNLDGVLLPEVEDEMEGEQDPEMQDNQEMSDTDEQ